MSDAIEEPSKKRLKQCSIMECFQPTTSKNHEKPIKRNSTGSETRAVMETTEKQTEKQSMSENLSENTSKLQDFHDETPPLFTLSSGDSDGETSSSGPQHLGTPIAELNHTQQCATSLPLLKSTADHTVLFKPDSKFDLPPKPSPDVYTDKWDEDHVRMPCSPKSLYPTGDDQPGTEKLESRWDLIRRTLNGKIQSSFDLQKAIVTYNNRYGQKSAFNGLHEFFAEALNPEECDAFFETILPRMIRLALQLPYLCTQPIPLLKQNMNHTLTLSQLQVASLLANAFFCTFPRRSQSRNNLEYRNYPSINFMGLYSPGQRKGRANRKLEKLKCLMNYFRRVTSEEPCGSVSFKRRCLNTFPDWEKSAKTLTRLHVASSGTIEKEGAGLLQMDFAHKCVGGGVLGWGCVQEEIRFVINPEMIVSRLFTEEMGLNECLIMTGCEQFCKQIGYGDTFEFSGNFIDTTPRDSWGRRINEVVAVDAKSFRSSSMQYATEWLKREVNKAYCAFSSPGTPVSNLEAVATGNWGCGVYKGDARLKALLQLIAAAEAGRDLAYFTFHDTELCKDIYEMYSFLKEKHTTAGNLWTLIENYRSVFHRQKSGSESRSGLSGRSLYEYIRRRLCSTNSYDSDTDVDG